MTRRNFNSIIAEGKKSVYENSLLYESNNENVERVKLRGN